MKTYYVYAGDARASTLSIIQRIVENDVHDEAYNAFLQLQDAEVALHKAIQKATFEEEPIKPKIPEGSWYTEHDEWHRVRIKTEHDSTYEIGAGLTPKKAALKAWEWLGKPKCSVCKETVVNCECDGVYLVPGGEISFEEMTKPSKCFCGAKKSQIITEYGKDKWSCYCNSCGNGETEGYGAGKELAIKDYNRKQSKLQMTFANQPQAEPDRQKSFDILSTCLLGPESCKRADR